MSDPQEGTEPEHAERLRAAADDLAQLREQLLAAGRGGADAAAVVASLKRYLDANGPALRAAARLVGEELRSQALAQLYRVRTEIDAQLAARRPVARTGGEDVGTKKPPAG